MLPVLPKSRWPLEGMLPVLMVVALSPARTSAQSRPSTDGQPGPELPDQVQSALSQMDDFSFSFAQPGFYAVLEYVKRANISPGHARPPVEVEDWQALLERPADFRGQPVTIEGVVGRSSAWQFEHEQYRQLGTVWQLELSRPDQPIAATLIFTNDASDIPLGVTIRATGYFVMIRQYYTASKRIGQAALLVAPGPTLISQQAPRPSARRDSRNLVGPLVTGTAALVIVWFLLRRSVARNRQTIRTLRASGPAPMSLADEFSAWAAREEDRPPPDHGADFSSPGEEAPPGDEPDGVKQP